MADRSVRRSWLQRVATGAVLTTTVTGLAVGLWLPTSASALVCPVYVSICNPVAAPFLTEGMLTIGAGSSIAGIGTAAAPLGATVTASGGAGGLWAGVGGVVVSIVGMVGVELDWFGGHPAGNWSADGTIWGPSGVLPGGWVLTKFATTYKIACAACTGFRWYTNTNSANVPATGASFNGVYNTTWANGTTLYMRKSSDGTPCVTGETTCPVEFVIRIAGGAMTEPLGRPPDVGQSGKLKTTATCIDATGSRSVEKITALLNYSAGVHNTLADVYAGVAICTATEIEGNVRVDWDPDVGADQPVVDFDAPTWVETFPTEFPSCMPPASCLLKLWRTQPGTETLLDCSKHAQACLDWYTDPDKDLVYSCKFGPYLVPLSSCDIYKDIDAPPECEGGLCPPPGGEDPPDPPPIDDECPPDFGLAILSPWWWYKAATCAMIDAFVPTEGFGPRIERISAAAEDRAPFSWVLGATETAQQAGSRVSGVTACPSWSVTVGTTEVGLICGSSFSEAIHNARPFLLAAALLSAFAPLVRHLFYASIPVLGGKGTPQ
jgi:hypothetical protein